MSMQKANQAIDKTVSQLIDKDVRIDEIYGAICVMKRTLELLLSGDILATLERIKEEKAK